MGIARSPASGMGKAIAMDFLKEGAKVVAADINLERLEELVEDVEDEELPVENLVTVSCNVTNDDDCKAAVDLAVYLASDESSFVNGASHVIDSGVCLSR